MEKISFNKDTINALPVPPAGKRGYYADSNPKARGLIVRVEASGKRAFYLARWIQGKSQRVKVGDWPTMTVEQARKKATAMNAAIDDGLDPAAERAKRQAEWTFAELFNWYLERHAKIRKRSWWKDEANFKNHLGVIAGLPVRKVTRSTIRQLHDAIGQDAGPYAANRVLALVSVVFTKAIAYELFEGANPAHGIETFPEESRDRRLSAAEVPRLLAAIDGDVSETFRDFVYILLFTGARRANVLAMRWDEIDFDARTWRIPMTKNGKPQVIPLEDAELAILRERHANADGPWVFPGRSDGKTGHLSKPEHGWKRVCDRAELGSYDEKGRFHPNIRIHDLRRSLGSWMVDTGASLPVIGQTLHHQSQATTAIYARLSLDPVREAKARAHGAIQEARKG